MPVYVKQYGRLGNQLFQKAAAIGYATKHGLDYCLSGRPRNSVYAIKIDEVQHNYKDLPFDENWRGFNDIILNGYWQSAKYFDHCREEVLKTFGFNWELRQGWCSVHVRRGDYLLYPDKHPVVPYDYLKLAVVLIYQKTGCENFHVFSDDIPWCKSVFEQCKHNIIYSEGHTPDEDLILGSCCEHNIISNSTFSWWQAWLGQNPNKVVITPSKDNWFGEGNRHLNTSDLIPESWIQIKY